jgi:hypothetical protein
MRYFLIILLVATSCAPVYVPNLRNSPLFTKAGEIQASAQITTGFDLQAAGAITNNIAVMTNYSYRNHTDIDDTDKYHRHKFWEGAVGYYSNEGKWCYEFFGGYGKGEGVNFGKFIDHADVSKVRGNYERFFFQPGIGMNKRVFHFSFIPRFSYVKFNLYEKLSEDGLVIERKRNPTDGELFFEPGFAFKVNMANNRAFFMTQVGLSFPVQENVFYDYVPSQLGVGFGFRIGGLKKEE